MFSLKFFWCQPEFIATGKVRQRADKWSIALKALGFSIAVHVVFVLALLLLPVAPQQTKAPVVIKTYSYTKAKPQQLSPAVAQVTPVLAPSPENTALQKHSQTKVKTKKAPALPEKKPQVLTKKTPNSQTQQIEKTATVVSSKKALSTTSENNTKTNAKGLSLADRALASAAGTFTPQPQLHTSKTVKRSVNKGEPELTPAIIKESKSFADGSLLVKGAHGCWKVPPTELRKGATWLSTSIECEPDTTAKQLEDILEKRRSYVK